MSRDTRANGVIPWLALAQLFCWGILQKICGHGPATRAREAPSEVSTSSESEGTTLSDVGIYTIGLPLAVILPATSSWVANTSMLWVHGIPIGLVVTREARISRLLDLAEYREPEVKPPTPAPG
jgi:hypothetical protein